MYPYMHFSDLHYIHTCIHSNNLLRVSCIHTCIHSEEKFLKISCIHSIMHQYMHLLKISCIYICIFPKNKTNCHAFNMHFHPEKRSNFIHAFMYINR